MAVVAVYDVRIYIGQVYAKTRGEATNKAAELLRDLANSNDGSEILANADPELTLAGVEE